MSARRPVLPFVVLVLGSWLVLPGWRTASADPAVIKRVEALNEAAIAAYDAGDNQKAKTFLLEAVVMSKEHNLNPHPSVARSYVHLGLVHVEGLKDEEKGLRYFTLALGIQPDIRVSADLTTASVTRVFDKAQAQISQKQQSAAAAAGTDAAEAAAPAKPIRETRAQKRARLRAERLAAKAAAAAEKKAALAEKKAALQAKKEKSEQDILLEEMAETRQLEAKARLESAQQETESLRQQLVRSEGRAKQEREIKERLQAEKTALERELSDTRAKEAREREAKETITEGNERLQKAKLESERHLHQQFSESEKKLQRQIAEAEAREKKERELREQLERDKADLAQKLAEVTAAQNAERESRKQVAKQLADATARETKEREAREKLEGERRMAEARANEQKQQQEQERLQREKLAEGPDLPASVTEPVQCAVADEAQLGQAIYVHCVPQGKAAGAALFYRASGSLHYNSLAMERNRKGWYVATIPGEKVAGKIMQYYVETRDKDGDPVANNGKANSPNVILLKKRVARVADATAGTFTSSSAQGAGR